MLNGARGTRTPNQRVMSFIAGVRGFHLAEKAQYFLQFVGRSVHGFRSHWCQTSDTHGLFGEQLVDIVNRISLCISEQVRIGVRCHLETLVP